MLEDIYPSKIVKNYYNYIRDYRNHGLRLVDPRTSEDVLASDYIDNLKINRGIQRIGKNFLPLGIHSVYRLMLDDRYKSEQVQLSFAALIQMEEVKSLMNNSAFRGLSIRGQSPVIFERENHEILRITRGEKGYRRMIFMPLGESSGFGINKKNNYEADPWALDLLDTIYNDGLLELAFEDSDGPFSVDLNQTMSMSLSAEQVTRMLTVLELRLDVGRAQMFSLGSEIVSASHVKVQGLVREMLKTGVFERG